MPRKALNIPKHILVEKYVNKNMSLAELSRMFKTDSNTIKKYLLLHDITLRTPRSKKPSMWLCDINISREYLYDKYIICRLPINAISRELNIDRHFIRELLKKYNITRRGKNSSYQYGFNEHFFEDINYNNSYWAGFIAADGCIIHNKKNQHRLQITLSEKDHYHLIKFKDAINYTGNVRKSSREYKGTLSRLKKRIYYISSISISSNKIVTDLNRNFNIVSKKSLILQPPNIKKENAVAFIAGYIDGDGCIFIRDQDRKLYPRINVLGTLDLLEWMQKTLIDELNFQTIPTINSRMGEKNKYYILNISCKSDIINLFNYLTKLDIPLLQRKWNKIEEYINVNGYLE